MDTPAKELKKPIRKLQKPVTFARDQWIALQLGTGVLAALLLLPVIRWTIKQVD